MNQCAPACGIILAWTSRMEITVVLKPLQLATTILLIALLGLSGCRTSPRAPTEIPSQEVSAEQAFARRDFVLAARTWQQQAIETTPERAASYRVRAADAWLLADQPDPATDLLKWISPDELDADDRSRLELVLADLALRQERPQEAKAHLSRAQAQLPSSSRSRFDTLTARAAAELDRPAMQDISRAAMLSDSMGTYNPLTALDLLESLENVPSGELALRADNPRADQQLTGWLDLALVIRQNLVHPDGVEESIRSWKARNPHHPVSEAEGLDLWLRYRQQFTPPGKVAVLLPESGRMSAAAAAIRDGLMSAFLNNPGGSEIMFFATSDQPESAISAYFSALDSGAKWIIGPLQKESIEAILALAGLSTPVLALNDLPAGFLPPPGLEGHIFGISLSQEKEAASIARHAIERGYQRAVVLTPETDWGERMASAFQADFLQEDQQIIAAARFREAENNYSPVIERILKIDESKARKAQLENTLQIPLEYEAVRRNDIDVIFLAASSEQARLIRPQLRFHDAGDIPVYSSGRVYSGQPNPTFNQDLNGIRFAITPWQLEHTEAEDMPELDSIRGGNFASLFAVGHDAWNVLPWLDLMNKDPDFSFTGYSGSYESSRGTNLAREPDWAVFRRGRPAPLNMDTIDKDMDETER